MTVDFWKPSQVVTFIAAAVFNVVALFEQTGASSATWYAAIDVANAVFPVPVHKHRQEQFALSWQSHQYMFTILPQRHTNSPVL